jgi:hypothetical protein
MIRRAQTKGQSLISNPMVAEDWVPAVLAIVRGMKVFLMLPRF